jgi:hypothetical protein
VNIAFAIAAFLSLLTWGVHTFIGGPQIAGPLLKSKLRHVPKYTNYYCWHLVTIVLLAMTAGFGYATFVPSGLDVAILFTVLSASFAIWSFVLILYSKSKLFELPQWIFFVLITGVALVGLMT